MYYLRTKPKAQALKGLGIDVSSIQQTEKKVCHCLLLICCPTYSKQIQTLFQENLREISRDFKGNFK